MSGTKTETVRAFVAGLAMPAWQPSSFEAKETTPAQVFNTAKNQAAVVGSSIVSFVAGVTPERRDDIVRSSLLAQLAARKRVPDATDVYGWYDEYFDILSNIGWIIQDHGFTTYTETTRDFEAHQAIMKVAASLLGPQAATMAVVRATLDAVRTAAENNPWITLFNRESISAHTARFQISLAEQDPNGGFLVSIMAFGLQATSRITQVLAARLRSNEVSMRQCSARISIDSEVLASVRDAIRRKTALHAQDFVQALPDL